MANTLVVKAEISSGFIFYVKVQEDATVSVALDQIFQEFQSFYKNDTNISSLQVHSFALATPEKIFLPPNSKLINHREHLKDMHVLLQKIPLSPFSTHVQTTKWSEEERSLRVRLAAAYRIFENLGWSEIIYNHLTARVPGSHHFLINPFGLHFSEITASSLVKIDVDGNVIDPGSTGLGINKAGYVIHGAIHKARSDLVAVMHTHSVDGVATATMKCGFLTKLSQLSCITGEPAYHDYQGIVVNEEEQKTLIKDLGDKKVMILRNHGLLSCGETLEEAFWRMYNLHLACKIQVATLSAVGVDGAIQVPDSVIEWNRQNAINSGTKEFGVQEFNALVRLLDKQDPSYSN